jgi:hypothetical protein
MIHASRSLMQRYNARRWASPQSSQRHPQFTYVEFDPCRMSSGRGWRMYRRNRPLRLCAAFAARHASHRQRPWVYLAAVPCSAMTRGYATRP